MSVFIYIYNIILFIFKRLKLHLFYQSNMTSPKIYVLSDYSYMLSILLIAPFKYDQFLRGGNDSQNQNPKKSL